MGNLKSIPIDMSDFKEQTLHINRHHRKIKADLICLQFIDRDTKQNVIYIPSLEISGYGATVEKANKMLEFSVKNYFDYLLASKDLDKELISLGWKHKKYNNKQYSQSYIDKNGVLQNFNVENNKVETAMISY